MEKLSKKSELAKAIGYVLTRWPSLTRYRDDGNIEIVSTPPSVRCVWSPWVAKIASSVAPTLGSDAGGDRATGIYRLIDTAILNGLYPEACLRQVLERIADHPINRVEELLPWVAAGALRADPPQQLAA